MNKSIIVSILTVLFIVFFFIYYILLKINEKNDQKQNQQDQNVKDKKHTFSIKDFFIVLLVVILSIFLSLPINYKGIVQEKFNKLVDMASNYVNTLLHHNSKDISEPTATPTITAKPTTTPSNTPLTKKSSPTPTPTQIPSFSSLIGMKETDAINICVQNDYKYSVEYYLGGDGTVISQSPKTNKKIKKQENIIIQIGISKNKFSKKLLKLINKKRTAKGLKKLKFSKKLNAACKILAKENVNSTNGTRPNGSRWSTVIDEKKIYLRKATFTTRDNITSLSDASKKLKYTGNNYGSENLLTPSYNIIGMAYSSKNMLVIIVAKG